MRIASVGEMVLLLHWSLLTYAAVVKILKKHDKRSGLLLRAPYLANVLQQVRLHSDLSDAGTVCILNVMASTGVMHVSLEP